MKTITVHLRVTTEEQALLSSLQAEHQQNLFFRVADGDHGGRGNMKMDGWKAKILAQTATWIAFHFIDWNAEEIVGFRQRQSNLRDRFESSRAFP